MTTSCGLCGVAIPMDKESMALPTTCWREVAGAFYHVSCLSHAVEEAKKMREVREVLHPTPAGYKSIIDVWICKKCGGPTPGYAAAACRNCGANEDWKGRCVPSDRL